ncbi:IS200/IS605 family element RNA-guided endonuclease TnpB [Venenivibrio stagnispumantis]|uniref:Transposase n=1 Tax=Venenivibrio stagnispumantis TaxID=407998 RepID=A0AA45WJP6_9AQUI|nr:transposase [Venenivibrio stagnispumantis]MCW4572402.1 transposase [Venenivibrio stagnispumantis]SMP03679.1 putative transposase [Venenivibrio stagnispumantis]
MKTEYTYRFRIFPNKEQEDFLNIQFGHCRFVYNHFLALSKKEYEGKGIKWKYSLYQSMLPKLKKEYPFLKQANSQSLQVSLQNLDIAYKNFFKGEAGFPKFKKKKSKQTVHIPQHFQIEKISKKRGQLKIPKLKTPIPIKMHRNIEGQIRSISITKTPDGRYYLNVLTRKEIQPLKPVNKTAGIDVGIKEFAVIHDGETTHHIENPKYLQKSEKKLIKLQRQLSRKQKGSKNWEKARQKVAKQHQKIVNQRKDFLHKVSIAITKQYDTIVVESLNIKGMIQNNKLSKQIADVSWSTFINMLEYKAKWYGRHIEKPDRFYASSKTCSVCGYKNDQLTLSIRKWQCPICKTIHDRDENASKNLYQIGLTHLTGGRVGTTQAEACGAGSVGGMQYNLQSTRYTAVKQEAPQFIKE